MNRISYFFEKNLKDNGQWEKASPFCTYVGDIHNHSGISYGYGTIGNAIAFARSQLDFFSVTGHFAWPDMESKGMNIPADVLAYHRNGFAKLRRNWPEVKKAMAAAEEKDFVPFLSYEYHSFCYGDYTILCKSLDEDLPEEVPEGMEDTRLTALLSAGSSQRDRFLCTPHHIGYKQGYRGINWSAFNEEVSPLVEICSMHGCAESMETRLCYLHTMGPRSGKNTYQGGLSLGHHFGVCGSTDHHNSAPGSYGSGRTVLYAPSLGRNEVWKALNERRVSAAVGDPFEVMLFAGGAFAGEIIEKAPATTAFDAYVSAFDRLEKVELIQNGRVVAGRYSFEPEKDESRGFVSFMFGWGKKHKPCSWDIVLRTSDARILFSSPRLRGVDMVDPLDVPKDGGGLLPKYERLDDGIRLHVVTDGNATSVTDSTQGFVCEIEGRDSDRLELSVRAEWDGRVIERSYSYTVAQLREGQNTEYIDGFVSPAVEIGKFRNIFETLCHLSGTVDTSAGPIYLRAYQKNGDAVYSSPISFR